MGFSERQMHKKTQVRLLTEMPHICTETRQKSCKVTNYQQYLSPLR